MNTKCNEAWLVLIALFCVGCHAVTAPDLQTAAEHNDSASIKALVAKGTPVDQPARHGYTALHTAAFEGNDDAVQTLLSLGANIEARNELGNTPLFEAATQGHASTVRILLDHGANRNPTNYGGHSLIDMLPSLERVGLGKPTYKEILGLLQAR